MCLAGADRYPAWVRATARLEKGPYYYELARVAVEESLLSLPPRAPSVILRFCRKFRYSDPVANPHLAYHYLHE